MNLQERFSEYSQIYTDRIASPHFGFFFIQTELPLRWSSASFWFLLYTDKVASPLIIGEFLVPFFIYIYTDRITSPLIIGEILVSSLYRQNYLARITSASFCFFFFIYIQTELPPHWSSACFWFFLYTDNVASPLIIGEFLSSFFLYI